MWKSTNREHGKNIVLQTVLYCLIAAKIFLLFVLSTCCLFGIFLWIFLRGTNRHERNKGYSASMWHEHDVLKFFELTLGGASCYFCIIPRVTEKFVLICDKKATLKH